MIMIMMLIITSATLVLFLIAYFTNRARVLNGLLFNVFVLCAGITLAFWALSLNNPVTPFLVLLLGLVLLLVLSFGLYALIALLLLNARAVLKREKRTLSNCLSLLLALGLIAVLAGSWAIKSAPPWVVVIWSGILMALAGFAFHVFNFLSSTLVANLVQPPKKQDYIVVLGSGLVNGTVPPLLAGRIDRAIRFYRKQEKKRQPPALIMSGGQGADEPHSEACAMRAYALQKGIPADRIFLEEKSTNTRENIRFSKELMDGRSQGPYRSIVSTSNYHLLRACMFALRAGLSPAGIGAKTALYYLPNALLREYIAILSMHKKFYLTAAGLLFLLGAVIQQLPEIFSYISTGGMFIY